MPEEPKADLKQQVLDYMSEGSTLTEACDRLEIDRSTVWHWRQADPDYEKAYAEARRAMADAIADDALTVVKRLAGDRLATPAMVSAGHNYSQRAAWYASKMLRKVYGDETPKTEFNFGDRAQVLVCTEEQRRHLISVRNSLLLPPGEQPTTETQTEGTTE